MRASRAGWTPSPASTVALVAVAVLAAPSVRAQRGEPAAIPPGQEPLVAAMLGGGPALPGGCRFAGASIDRSHVAARYACGSGAPVLLELRHPSEADAGEALTRTRRFAIVARTPAPPALVAAVKARVEAGEAGWRWRSLGAGTDPGATLPIADPAAHLAPAVAERLREGIACYREGRYREARDALLDPVRQDPRGGGVAVLAASLLGLAPDRVTVERAGAEADSHVDDAVAQLVAGLGAYQLAAVGAERPVERARLYATAADYLARCRPALESESAVLVHLALGLHRAGRSDEATALEPVLRGEDDPDAHLARAELLHRADPKRAAAAIEACLAAAERLRATGETLNELPLSRARAALEQLRTGGAPHAGEDPFVPAPPPAPPAPSSAPSTREALLATIEIVLILAFMVRLVTAMRSRRA